MKRSGRLGKVKVTADGEGVVSHAGAELLREMAGFTGLIDAWDRALIGTYKAMPIHFPGTVLADLAVAIADGADSISDLKSLRDQPVLFGPVASTSTAWRVLDRVAEAHLSKLRAGRATARAAAWAAGAAPDLSRELCLDIDATIVIAHSEKELASRDVEAHVRLSSTLVLLGSPRDLLGRGARRHRARGKGGVQHHRRPHLCAHHGPRCTSRSGPAQKRRPRWSPPLGAGRRGGGHPWLRRVLPGAGVAFSFGFAIDENVRKAIVSLAQERLGRGNRRRWRGARRRLGGRDHRRPRSLGLAGGIPGDRAQGASPPRRPAQPLRRDRRTAPHRLHLRRENGQARPLLFRSPGSKYATAAHARVEDRIRQAKAAGLRNLPCKLAPENHAWLECVLAAFDLVAWSKLICFFDEPALAHCEIAAFRYRVLHMAARITRGGRVVRLRLDRTWAWSKQLALGFTRLRAAFA